MSPRMASKVTGAAKVAEMLVNAGADVDATAEVYGGKSTTLGLVATSVHPERAGVQFELMELLLHHGAVVDAGGDGDRGIVNLCLANGRRPAAEFLAKRGARLDLEAAAGLGALETVKSFFYADGGLIPNATKTQMERGFLWAAEYGRNPVIEFLLQRGVDVETQAGTGLTALHWAVVGGQMETVQLLIARGASLEAKNVYGGDALGQALWSAVNVDPALDYVSIIETLIADGAIVRDGSISWLQQQETGPSAVKQRVADLLRRHGAKS